MGKCNFFRLLRANAEQRYQTRRGKRTQLTFRGTPHSAAAYQEPTSSNDGISLNRDTTTLRRQVRRANRRRFVPVGPTHSNRIEPARGMNVEAYASNSRAGTLRRYPAALCAGITRIKRFCRSKEVETHSMHAMCRRLLKWRNARMPMESPVV